MIDNGYYSQEVHGPYELHDIGNLELEEGGTIRGCKLAYATFGSLNGAKDNAVLVPTWYSGTNKIIEQVYIGQGRALDPDKYFIIIINQIGGGLSTSPHNTPAPAGMGNFPHVRIGDVVRAQYKLVTEKFGLKRFALVVGGSMGAQQTYEWGHCVGPAGGAGRRCRCGGTGKSRGYSNAEIAAKIDFSPDYVGAICYLLEHGENRLLVAVERGVMPPNIAIEIARANEDEVQQALAEAYEKKALPGNQVLAIRRIIQQRNQLGKGGRSGTPRAGSSGKVTAAALIQSYQKEAQRQKLLVKKADLTQSRLIFVVNAVRRLFDDDNFVTLLRAEGMHTLPRPLAAQLELVEV